MQTSAYFVQEILWQLILPLVGLCVYIPLRIKKRLRPALLIKTGLSVAFILFALRGIVTQYVADDRFSASPWVDKNVLFTSLLVIAGLVCGLIGDIFLDLKDIHIDTQSHYMFVGFSSFMLGHFFYFAAIFHAYQYQGDAWGLALPLAAGFGLLMFLGMAALEKPMKLDYGKFRPILLVYTFVLSTMTAYPLAIGFYAMDATMASIFGVGMVLFFLSDLVLSQVYFSTARKEPSPVHIALNYILYYGGQFTIAAALYFLPYQK
ncbi:MAG: lysoplasmalogenase [Oscillospiraceae bacterium]|jgi:uncharacterized membrane protein YhhN|nr:lysoplasmalogenase [Oscillospiraceae bacterium]